MGIETHVTSLGPTTLRREACRLASRNSQCSVGPPTHGDTRDFLGGSWWFHIWGFIMEYPIQVNDIVENQMENQSNPRLMGDEPHAEWDANQCHDVDNVGL